MDVMISGASGLIGTALAGALTEAGHRPIALVRRMARGEDEIAWKPSEGEIDGASFEGVDAVVHLAGAGIGDRRWNERYKQVLIRSRTEGTRLLATTLAGLSNPPRRLISGSAIGFYGDRGDEVLTEASPSGDTFLSELCLQWEAAAAPAAAAGIAAAFIRTGIVLSDRGGALTRMLPLFKLGLGGRFGSGRQFMSWITLDDQVNAIVHLLGEDTTGPVNLTAPQPVTNADFGHVLGRVLGRPTFLPVPRFAPRLALGGEMADALLFDSARVTPSVLTDTGFRFAHGDLESGLRAVLGH